MMRGTVKYLYLLCGHSVERVTVVDQVRCWCSPDPQDVILTRDSGVTRTRPCDRTTATRYQLPAGWLTTLDVAERAGISDQTVVRACNRGDIPGAEKRPYPTPPQVIHHDQRRYGGRRALMWWIPRVAGIAYAENYEDGRALRWHTEETELSEAG